MTAPRPAAALCGAPRPPRGDAQGAISGRGALRAQRGDAPLCLPAPPRPDVSAAERKDLISDAKGTEGPRSPAPPVMSPRRVFHSADLLRCVETHFQLFSRGPRRLFGGLLRLTFPTLDNRTKENEVSRGRQRMLREVLQYVCVIDLRRGAGGAGATRGNGACSGRPPDLHTSPCNLGHGTLCAPPSASGLRAVWTKAA